MKADLIIKNIGILATLKGGLRKGKDMENLSIIKDAYVAIRAGKILEVGHKDNKLLYSDTTDIYDACGLVVTPGLIDAHTHLVHGGSRENEFKMKLQGVPYIDILNQGGILSTVKATKKATSSELVEKAKKSLNKMMEFGVTTVESKSGYGLSLETELKQLEVNKILNDTHPVDIVSTFLGAHAIPNEFKKNPDGYVDFVIDMLPLIKEKKLAEFCDVFCEKGVFSVKQTEKILMEARKLGFDLKIHADEIVSLGGGELAAKMNMTSADHLMAVSDEGIIKMSENNVIANLLPATSFSLGKKYARARKMIDENLAVSISSDYNPGSCPSENLQFVMQLGFLGLKMTPNEVFSAVTINAAYAINRQNEIGSIEIGKKADLVIFDSKNIDYILYHFGINHTKDVFKEGKLIVKDGKSLINKEEKC